MSSPASRPVQQVAVNPGCLAAWLETQAAEQGFALDGAQHEALRAFERIERELAQTGAERKGWLRFLQADPAPVRGVYLWGGVGRGKSFLMDGFFEFASERRKQREHFHRFMQSIHHDLKRLQGQAEPMQAVADRVAGAARLLCLDEFQVTDIGDAMLTFSDARTQLSGRISTQAGAPGDSLYIAAFPADRSLWRPQSRRITSARADTDGRWVITGLPPGDYLVVALTDLAPGDLWDLSLLQQLLPAGVPVSLTDGEHTTRDLTINKNHLY